MNDFGINILSLSDTIGSSKPDIIEWLFAKLINEFPAVDFGAHLHTHQNNWKEKLDAALKAGCRRYDGALLGFGGCPMAKDDLVGNMPSEKMINYFLHNKQELNIDTDALNNSLQVASSLFL